MVTPTLELYLSRESTVPPAGNTANRRPGDDPLPEEELTVGPGQPPTQAPAEPSESTDVAGSHVVRAPMVGTVYRAPEPGKAPFVEIGDHVEATDTVLLVEAMKVFTSVSAGLAGVVTAIYVENAQAVEFDQVMLRIDPDTAPQPAEPTTDAPTKPST